MRMGAKKDRCGAQIASYRLPSNGLFLTTLLTVSCGPSKQVAIVEDFADLHQRGAAYSGSLPPPPRAGRP